VDLRANRNNNSDSVGSTWVNLYFLGVIYKIMKSLPFYLLLVGCVAVLTVVLDPLIGTGLILVVAGTTLIARALGK